MASLNEVRGKAYKVNVDPVNDIWEKLSFWTMACDVFNDDNDNDLESCCGGITGITDSLSSNSTTVALSAVAVKKLQEQINSLVAIKNLT